MVIQKCSKFALDCQKSSNSLPVLGLAATIKSSVEQTVSSNLALEKGTSKNVTVNKFI